MIVFILLVGSLLGAVALTPYRPFSDEVAVAPRIEVVATPVLRIGGDGSLTFDGVARGTCPGSSADNAFKQCVTRATQVPELTAGNEVRIAAEDGVPYARVVAVLDVLRERGITHIALEAPPSP